MSTPVLTNNTQNVYIKHANKRRMLGTPALDKGVAIELNFDDDDDTDCDDTQSDLSLPDPEESPTNVVDFVGDDDEDDDTPVASILAEALDGTKTKKAQPRKVYYTLNSTQRKGELEDQHPFNFANSKWIDPTSESGQNELWHKEVSSNVSCGSELKGLHPAIQRMHSRGFFENIRWACGQWERGKEGLLHMQWTCHSLCPTGQSNHPRHTEKGWSDKMNESFQVVNGEKEGLLEMYGKKHCTHTDDGSTYEKLTGDKSDWAKAWNYCSASNKRLPGTTAWFYHHPSVAPYHVTITERRLEVVESTYRKTGKVKDCVSLCGNLNNINSIKTFCELVEEDMMPRSSTKCRNPICRSRHLFEKDIGLMGNYWLTHEMKLPNETFYLVDACLQHPKFLAFKEKVLRPCPIHAMWVWGEGGLGKTTSLDIYAKGLSWLIQEELGEVIKKDEPKVHYLESSAGTSQWGAKEHKTLISQAHVLLVNDVHANMFCESGSKPDLRKFKTLLECQVNELRLLFTTTKVFAREYVFSSNECPLEFFEQFWSETNCPKEADYSAFCRRLPDLFHVRRRSEEEQNLIDTNMLAPPSELSSEFQVFVKKIFPSYAEFLVQYTMRKGAGWTGKRPAYVYGSPRGVGVENEFSQSHWREVFLAKQAKYTQVKYGNKRNPTEMPEGYILPY